MTSRVLCALFSILLIAIATPTPVPAAQQTVTYIHFSNETRRYIWVTARPDANSAANVGAWCVARTQGINKRLKCTLPHSIFTYMNWLATKKSAFI